MKILILIGSYRHNGNTDQITGMIIENLQKEAERHQTILDIETIYLGQQNLQFCRGCRICYDRGEQLCPLKDDLLLIKAKMLVKPQRMRKNCFQLFTMKVISGRLSIR
ncbi:MAG: NAD(P)H-dependent oxidoreductase [Flexilinea sp.]